MFSDDGLFDFGQDFSQSAMFEDGNDIFDAPFQTNDDDPDVMDLDLLIQLFGPVRPPAMETSSRFTELLPGTSSLQNIDLDAEAVLDVDTAPENSSTALMAPSNVDSEVVGNRRYESSLPVIY